MPAREMIPPFGILLLFIAMMPLALPHFWEKNRNKAIVAALIWNDHHCTLLAKQENETLICKQVLIKCSEQDLRITPLSPPASGGKCLHAMFSELPPVDAGTEGGNA